jgi:hypothetical protein
MGALYWTTATVARNHGELDLVNFQGRANSDGGTRGSFDVAPFVIASERL